MSHIFISYSKEDIDFARYLRALLEAEHFAVWMDEARLTPSARWWKSIEQNIQDCAALIVIMSPAGAESDWVEREILLAEKLRRPLFPVLLAGDPWSRLANIQYEDLRAGLRAKLSPHFLNGLRGKASRTDKPADIVFAIEHGDITRFAADVTAFKYSQNFRGADAAAGSMLIQSGIPVEDFRPTSGQIGDYRYVETRGALQSPHVLYVGTPGLRRLGYVELREFAERVLSVLREVAPVTSHLALTTHGPGFGLDEKESLLSLFAGFRRAMLNNEYPPTLKHITIVEFQHDRVERLRAIIDEALKEADYTTPLEEGWGYRLGLPDKASTSSPEPQAIETAGGAAVKPHAFVAMPIDRDMEDIFFYGIQSPIHALGLLCERIEQDTLTDDLLDQARQRIETASVVVADVTGGSPNVYLQIGYAWGRSRPVVLLAREGETPRFETKTAPLLNYRRIKDVEEQLAAALAAMKQDGIL